MAPSNPHQTLPPALLALLLATLCCPAWGKGGTTGSTTTTTTTGGYWGYSTGYTGYRPPTTTSGYYYYYSAPRPAFLSPTTSSYTSSATGVPGPSTEPSPSVATTGWWPTPLFGTPSPPSQPLPQPSPTPSPPPSGPRLPQGEYGSHWVASGSRSPQGDNAVSPNQGDWEEPEDEPSMLAVAALIAVLFLACLLLVLAALASIARAKSLSGQDSDDYHDERGVEGYLGGMSQPVVENPQPAMLGYPLTYDDPHQLGHPDTTGGVAGPPPLPIHETPTFPTRSGSGGWQQHWLYPDLPVLE